MRRDRPVSCATAAEAIPDLSDGEGAVGAGVRAHVATCLRCQAELARYRRMSRNLRGLRAERCLPPAGGLPATLAALGAGRRRRGVWGDAGDLPRSLAPWRGGLAGWKVAAGGVVATAAAGAAAGVAGTLVRRSRRRSLAG